MVHQAAQQNGRRRSPKHGQVTPQGRQNQIASRLAHGIRSRSPVLLSVESEAEWQQHLEGFRQSYAPVGEAEECLVHLIAYQFWRWIERLIPYERDLTFARMTTPPESLIGDGCSSADIAKVLQTPAAELVCQENAACAQLVRYEALGNGQNDSLVLSASEVEELIERFRHRLTNGEDEDLEGNRDDENDCDDENEVARPDDQASFFDGENRSWTGTEVQEQLRILCEAAGEDWRTQLSFVLYDYKRELDQRSSGLAAAREHVRYNRILGKEELERVLLYERQLSATLRHLVSQLERHQARRLGQPLAPPVAIDVAVAHHGVKSEIP
jgi:hypothetical protein